MLPARRLLFLPLQAGAAVNGLLAPTCGPMLTSNAHSVHNSCCPLKLHCASLLSQRGEHLVHSDTTAYLHSMDIGCMLLTERIFWASRTLSSLKLETPMA